MQLYSIARAIWGPFVPDSDLRHHGLSISARGDKNAKKFWAKNQVKPGRSCQRAVIKRDPCAGHLSRHGNRVFVKDSIDSAEVYGPSGDHQGDNKPFENDPIKSGDAAIDETREPFYKFLHEPPPA